MKPIKQIHRYYYLNISFYFQDFPHFPSLGFTFGNLDSDLCLNSSFIYSLIFYNFWCWSVILISFYFSFLFIPFKFILSCSRFKKLFFYFFLNKSANYFSYCWIFFLYSSFRLLSLLHYSINFVFWASTPLIFYSLISL